MNRKKRRKEEAKQRRINGVKAKHDPAIAEKATEVFHAMRALVDEHPDSQALIERTAEALAADPELREIISNPNKIIGSEGEVAEKFGRIIDKSADIQSTFESLYEGEIAPKAKYGNRWAKYRSKERLEMMFKKAVADRTSDVVREKLGMKAKPIDTLSTKFQTIADKISGHPSGVHMNKTGPVMGAPYEYTGKTQVAQATPEVASTRRLGDLGMAPINNMLNDFASKGRGLNYDPANPHLPLTSLRGRMRGGDGGPRYTDETSFSAEDARAAEVRSYPSEKAFTEECVKVFNSCADALFQAARSPEYDRERDKAIAQHAWSAMQRARLFMIEPRKWAALYNAADRYCEEQVGNEWIPFDGSPASQESIDKLNDFYANAGTRWPFPDPLPFDSCFFCYGAGLKLGGMAAIMRVGPRDRDKDPRLMGNLLWWEGDVAYAVALYACIEDDGTATMRIGFVYEGDVRVDVKEQPYLERGAWSRPASLDPWILNSLVHSINEYKTIMQEYAPTLANRLDRKKLSKQNKTLMPLPSPFYLVRLKDELITPQRAGRAKAPGPGKVVDWSHRWDVRGHECVRFMRGDMPIDEKLAVKLRKRGYRIYEGRPLSQEDANRVLKRGQRAPSPNEWVAVLSYWRDAFIKGPPEKPYVPAARIEGGAR